MHGKIMPTGSKIKSEPIIKVGIILPEDRRKSIKIHIPKDDTIYSNKSVSGDLEINIYEDKVSLNNNIYEEIHLTPETENDYLTIYSVPAGRNFHWQKEIDIKVSGTVHINNFDGHLILSNKLPLEQYLTSVATAEMSPECPPPLLEAQIIAARSWLLANRKVNHPNLDFDVCNDDCCQRYQGIVEISESAEQAMLDTYGKVLVYHSQICDARYSKCCGGITEAFENVWESNAKPYLSSIIDNSSQKNKIDSIEDFINSKTDSFCSPYYVKSDDLEKYLGNVDIADSYFRWEIKYSQEKLASILNTKLNLDVKNVNNMIPVKRGFSGRIIELLIDFVNRSNINKSIALTSEYDIRNALHEKFLCSSAIIIEQGDNNNFKLTGAGWGHGVGMCQIGALGMALNGYSANDILKHYFKGSEVKKIY